MTMPVQELLKSFDGLSEAEQIEAAAVILRRTIGKTPELDDDAMTAAADQIFQELDARETEDASG